MSPKLSWHEIETDNTNNNDIVTYRASVHGGWLVCVWAGKDRADAGGKDIPGGSNWGGGVTFVYDVDHKWDVALKK